MRLKKYEAKTEEEAVEMAKEELGQDALILSVRKIKPRGFLGFFKGSFVEVTSASEEKKEDFKKEFQYQKEILDTEKNKLLIEKNLKDRKIASQQETIENLKSAMEELSYKLTVSKYENSGNIKYDSGILQAFYETMLNQGVLPEIAEDILKDAKKLRDKEALNLNTVAKIVYNNIINVLGKPAPILKPENGQKAKTVFFMGPTGVGKTTTIAKLSANFILKDGYRVGLITSDTYRIAAVEQLKTYADILGVEVGVAYETEEFIKNYEKMYPVNDIICVDTAGRSHKNEANFEDIKSLLANVPKDNVQIYLVLSLTTKYEDLLDIVKKFSMITDFKLIFTKLDETLSYGTILNICHKTGKKADYITLGQNVPDDIELMEPETIARALLGLEGFA